MGMTTSLSEEILTGSNPALSTMDERTNKPYDPPFDGPDEDKLHDDFGIALNKAWTDLEDERYWNYPPG